MNDKPKRLSKLEDAWQKRGSAYVSFREVNGHWYVTLDGEYDHHELVEIYRALKAANKAGRL